jgi:hypothetical protein
MHIKAMLVKCPNIWCTSDLTNHKLLAATRSIKGVKIKSTLPEGELNTFTNHHPISL